MADDALKLTAYLGERHRTAHAATSDALLDLFGRRRVRLSMLLRGAAGFGRAHHLRTDRLLTLSEDLPLVALAVDAPARVERLAADTAALLDGGLVTLERVRLGALPAPAPAIPADTAKLTVHLGRRDRAGGRPAHVAVCDVLRRRGVAGATVLLGVDGTVAGERRRANLLGRNVGVPVMVVAVGEPGRLTAAVAELETLPGRPLLTFERALVLKRDGALLARPEPAAARAGPAWHKLTVYSSEQARAGGAPQHEALLRRLRRDGARGATVLRGVWGFHGDHAPHGDRLLQVRRHVPVVTTVVDRPAAVARLFAAVDELTAQRGLVTLERVPVLADRPAGTL